MGTWTRKDIETLLRDRDDAVMKAALRMAYLQTPEERRGRDSYFQNGWGPTKYDAGFLEGISRYYLANGYMTERQIQEARRRLYKYSGQLASLANQKNAS